MMANRGYEGKASSNLNLKTLPLGKDITITMDRKLGEPQDWPGHRKKTPWS
jgi:hypothetical protein